MATKKAKTVSKAKSSVGAKKPKTQSTAVAAAKPTPKNKPKTIIKNFFSKKYTGTENIYTVFKKPAFVGALVAEVLGAFLLTMTFLAIQASPLYVMFAAIGVSVLVFAFSGAHINPIVSLGAFVTRRISLIRLIFYVIAQTIGAMLAYVMLKSFIGDSTVTEEMAMYGQTAPEVFSMAKLIEGKEWCLFAVELIGASIIAFFFARAIQYKKSVFTFAFTVGLGVFVAIIFAFTAISYIGGGGFALNPAIAVAMQAFTGDTVKWSLVIYMVAPLIGGIIGFMLNDIIAISTENLEA